MIGYNRRFIKEFAKIAKPLLSLLKQDGFRRPVVERWDDECTRSFQELKERMKSAPILAFPDFRRPFTLYTDASDYGLGAILSQHQNDGTERVIAYASRTLHDAEIRVLTVTEKECLAVVWSVQKFRPYLHGQKFTLVTDHHALQWLKSIKDPSGMLARWSLNLQEYDYEVIHRAGRLHTNVDALSRNPLSDTIYSVILAVEEREAITREEWKSAQKEDEVIQQIKKYIEEGIAPNDQVSKG